MRFQEKESKDKVVDYCFLSKPKRISYSPAQAIDRNLTTLSKALLKKADSFYRDSKEAA